MSTNIYAYCFFCGKSPKIVSTSCLVAGSSHAYCTVALVMLNELSLMIVDGLLSISRDPESLCIEVLGYGLASVAESDELLVE